MNLQRLHPRALLAMIVFAIPVSVSRAEVVSLGDAQIDLDRYGAISALQINRLSFPTTFSQSIIPRR